ncbi:hypothetical protein B296_00055749 [Ensete ventricosum]|uniref:Uncharacterized protein n=1 Tax=Ensete ventricosum TaxID=4639 RepID=A0A426WYR5_ENSVE|nr:hypothetical protein B296_00055749 [Ensete ventricosum]
MEGENKPSSSVSDELASVDSSFGSSSSSWSSNYFGTVFPPPSFHGASPNECQVIAKHSSPGDLYRTLNRQSTDGQIGNAQNAAAGS